MSATVTPGCLACGKPMQQINPNRFQCIQPMCERWCKVMRIDMVAFEAAQQRMATLASVSDNDFTPEALRNHAEVLDAISAGLSAEGDANRNEEHRAVLKGLAEDCLRFAAVFRGIADRDAARVEVTL